MAVPFKSFVRFEGSLGARCNIIHPNSCCSSLLKLQTFTRNLNCFSFISPCLRCRPMFWLTPMKWRPISRSGLLTTRKSSSQIALTLSLKMIVKFLTPMRMWMWMKLWISHLTFYGLIYLHTNLNCLGDCGQQYVPTKKVNKTLMVLWKDQQVIGRIDICSNLLQN